MSLPGNAPKEIYEVGEVPPLGLVPHLMKAATIRQSRFGAPLDALRVEEVPVPRPGPRQVLVYVMAAGINYNTIWAGLGMPLDVIAMRQKRGEEEDFHIGGSDAAGVVWAVGEGVRDVKVGDPVVLEPGICDFHASDVLMGVPHPASRSALAWGFETNYGSLAQFTLAEDYQCFPKPPQLSWEEASCYLLNAGTAYRQLMAWHPHTVKPGEPVLIWGGAGGLGSMATQITRVFGGVPVAVVSREDKFDYCLSLGAKGVVDRSRFSHWGRLPDPSDGPAFAAWVEGVRAFSAEFWKALGEPRKPTIVFEHPGADTLPTSIYLCENGGMVVVCAGTSGFIGDVDLRFLWMRSKRLQGSHGASYSDYACVHRLVAEGRIDPCLSRVGSLDEVGKIHQMMFENEHPPGNMALLVNAPEPGLRCLPH